MSDFLFVTVNLSQFLVHINAKKKIGWRMCGSRESGFEQCREHRHWIDRSVFLREIHFSRVLRGTAPMAAGDL